MPRALDADVCEANLRQERLGDWPRSCRWPPNMTYRVKWPVEGKSVVVFVSCKRPNQVVQVCSIARRTLINVVSVVLCRSSASLVFLPFLPVTETRKGPSWTGLSTARRWGQDLSTDVMTASP
jgi:hypothetical protein